MATHRSLSYSSSVLSDNRILAQKCLRRLQVCSELYRSDPRDVFVKDWCRSVRILTILARTTPLPSLNHDEWDVCFVSFNVIHGVFTTMSHDVEGDVATDTFVKLLLVWSPVAVIDFLRATHCEALCRILERIDRLPVLKKDDALYTLFELFFLTCSTHAINTLSDRCKRMICIVFLATRSERDMDDVQLRDHQVTTMVRRLRESAALGRLHLRLQDPAGFLLYAALEHVDVETGWTLWMVSTGIARAIGIVLWRTYRRELLEKSADPPKPSLTTTLGAYAMCIRIMARIGRDSHLLLKVMMLESQALLKSDAQHQSFVTRQLPITLSEVFRNFTDVLDASRLDEKLGHAALVSILRVPSSVWCDHVIVFVIICMNLLFVLKNPVDAENMMLMAIATVCKARVVLHEHLKRQATDAAKKACCEVVCYFIGDSFQKWVDEKRKTCVDATRKTLPLFIFECAKFSRIALLETEFEDMRYIVRLLDIDNPSEQECVNSDEILREKLLCAYRAIVEALNIVEGQTSAYVCHNFLFCGKRRSGNDDGENGGYCCKKCMMSCYSVMKRLVPSIP